MIKKRVGIMGGTFNPPHIGHLKAAQAVLTHLKLDKIFFIPNGSFLHKKAENTESAKHRFNMTKLMIEDFHSFEVLDIEAKSNEISYTSKTLLKLHEIYEDTHFYFIVGADSLDYMEKWKNPEIIFLNASIAVVDRLGFDMKEKADKLKKCFGADIHIIPMEKVVVSSSEIRNRIKNGKSIEDLTDKKVIDYIRRENLYKDA